MSEKYEIQRYNPCEEAVEFRARFENFEQAWGVCERGDWMLWIAEKLSVDIRLLTRAKALIANLVRDLMPQKSRKAIDTALAFSEGNATRKELNAAALAALAAPAADAAAAYAAAAADVAPAAHADDVAAAADAAARAAHADVDSRNEILRKAADICRDVLTDAVIQKIRSNDECNHESYNESGSCCCSMNRLSPHDECPRHGKGIYPDRCIKCGQFLISKQKQGDE